MALRTMKIVMMIVPLAIQDVPGRIPARQKFIGSDNAVEGEVEEYGKVFVGEPYEVDCEASQELGLRVRYLDLIREAKLGLEP